MRQTLIAFAAALLVAGLAACVGSATLSPALNARLDQPGTTLDAAAAIDLINQYRSASGVPPLVMDVALNVAATSAAASYAGAEDIAAGRASLGPVAERVGAPQAAEKVSAGYGTFGETFSGWRNNPNDAGALAAPWASRAGIGVVYDPDTGFGTYWVLILAAS
ncbi:MAG TPA: CAP domain-containing protein [Devosiaceae bacterium]|nr:CAP domain-containing protein [Devosiaceae bacterium]